MSNNTVLNLGSGGDSITDIDLANFGSFGYPTVTGKLPACAIYVSQAIGSIPAPLTTSNTLPVTLVGATPAGANTIGNVGIVAGTAAIGTVTTNADAALAAGTAPSKMLVGGTQFNTTAPAPTNTQTLALQTDSAGNLLVSLEGRKATYMASSGSYTLAATPTDIAQLAGSGTKTVKLLKCIVQFAPSTTTNQNITVTGIKRSTAGSGFTNTATSVPTDSNFAGATATANFTTTNPTVGTTVGSAQAVYLQPPTVATAGNTAAPPNTWLFDFTAPGAEPITLRGTAQTFAINLAGATLTGSPTAIVNWLWTEE